MSRMSCGPSSPRGSADDELLELIIIAGWYRLLSYVINAARIECEPWAARFAGSEGEPIEAR